jgi:hypothetical protein
MITPQTWVDEDRAEFVERIVDGMVAEMTYDSIKQCVWDLLYDDLLHQEWPDLWMHAEKYAPEFLEQFENKGDTPSF